MSTNLVSKTKILTYVILIPMFCKSMLSADHGGPGSKLNTLNVAPGQWVPGKSRLHGWESVSKEGLIGALPIQSSCKTHTNPKEQWQRVALSYGQSYGQDTSPMVRTVTSPPLGWVPGSGGAYLQSQHLQGWSRQIRVRGHLAYTVRPSQETSYAEKLS